MRLVEEHHRAALAYSRAARALSQKRTSCAASKLEELRQAAKAARAKCAEARIAVNHHLAEHGC
jgi:hypothetical protein